MSAKHSDLLTVSDMEDKIFDIVTDLIREDITKQEANERCYKLAEPLIKAVLKDIEEWKKDGCP